MCCWLHIDVWPKNMKIYCSKDEVEIFKKVSQVCSVRAALQIGLFYLQHSPKKKTGIGNDRFQTVRASD